MADADAAGPDEIQGAAEAIVGQPQYRPPERGVLSRVADWLGEVFEPVGDAIGRFLEWVAERLGLSGGIVGSGGSGGFVFGWIVLAIGAAALLWFLFKVMPRRRLRSEKPEEAMIEQRQRHRFTRKQWLDRAAAAEADRDFTEAVRARYRALAAGLADHDQLDPSEAATSGEHLRAFADSEPRRQQFRTATDTYERAWFGDHPVGPAESEALAGIDRVLVEGHGS